MPSIFDLDLLSPPFVIEAAADPVWLRCLEAVYQAVVDLELAGIAEASIIKLEIPLTDRYFGSTTDGSTKNTAGQTPLDYPGIIVWPYQQETHETGEGTNEHDQIVYPVAISFVDKNAGKTGPDAMVGSRTAMLRHMKWREKISHRFRYANWSASIPEVQWSQVEYNAYAIPEAYWRSDLYHGAIVVKFVCWETRYGNE